MPVPADFDFDPVLEGQTLRLRPIRVDEFEALYAVSSDPLVWAQHPARQRFERAVFEEWFAEALVQHALIVEERATGRVIGSTRFYEWNPSACAVAIGYTFLARDHWGGATNAEKKGLMLAHAFKWANTVWFHVNKDNARSRKAMEKIGGRYSHEAPHVINGAPAVDYVFYRIDAPAGGSRL